MPDIRTKAAHGLHILLLVYTGTTFNKIKCHPIGSMFSLRSSEYLDRKAISAIKQAPRTATALRRPLNVFVTISITQTMCPKEEISARFRLLRDRNFYRWATYTPKGAQESRNGPPTFAWVIEAPNDGDDIHWLLHVKPERLAEFSRLLPVWVEKRFGIAAWADHPVDIAAEETPNNRALYMVKGANPCYAQFYYIPEDKLKAQGVVFGKRGGVSQNLGTTSRAHLKSIGAIVPKRSHKKFQAYPKRSNAQGSHV